MLIDTVHQRTDYHLCDGTEQAPPLGAMAGCNLR